MAIEENEEKPISSVPRVSVRRPYPASWKLDLEDLIRYEKSKEIVGDDDHPDVVFRKRVDADTEAIIKEGYVDALAGIVLHQNDSHCIVSAMLHEGNVRFKKEEELLGKGVLPTEISHAPDKLVQIFRPNQKSHSYKLITGDGAEKPLSMLDIKTQFDEGTEDKFVKISLTQEQSPWRGKVTINIPLSHNRIAGSLIPDAENSSITDADGTLEKVGFIEASELMISTANAAAEDFEIVLQEIDAVFRDAEARQG